MTALQTPERDPLLLVHMQRHTAPRGEGPRRTGQHAGATPHRHWGDPAIPVTMPGMALKPILISNAVRAAVFGAWLSLGGCAALSPAPATDTTGWQRQLQAPAPLPAVLLLGEQHDAPEHQAWERDTVQTLARQQRLAAVVLEMAHSGHSTRALTPTASETEVQEALDWQAAGWDWAPYAPVVMAAVQAGVPVHGGNLRRSHMREVMQQTHWDQHLPPTAWERQRDAIRSGHCDLLPVSQLTPMARIQLAKDASIAAVAQAQLQPGQTVLVIAGRGHVLRSVGIPTWLPAGLRAQVAVAQAQGAAPTPPGDYDWLVQTPAVPAQDHCADLRARWQTGAPAAPQTQKP